MSEVENDQTPPVTGAVEETGTEQPVVTSAEGASEDDTPAQDDTPEQDVPQESPPAVNADEELDVVPDAGPFDHLEGEELDRALQIQERNKELEAKINESPGYTGD